MTKIYITYYNDRGEGPYQEIFSDPWEAIHWMKDTPYIELVKIDIL